MTSSCFLVSSFHRHKDINVHISSYQVALSEKKVDIEEFEGNNIVLLHRIVCCNETFTIPTSERTLQSRASIAHCTFDLI